MYATYTALHEVVKIITNGGVPNFVNDCENVAGAIFHGEVSSISKVRWRDQTFYYEIYKT